MNFSILILTKVWGIKYWVLNGVDSESERILGIRPSWGQLGEGRGGAKMNFSILTSTKKCGVSKYRVLNCVDSESGRIFIIPPPQGRLGGGQGAGQK